MKKMESETLAKNFEKNINPEIQKDLENLAGLGIDPELFDKFKKRIFALIENNPGSEGTVSSEIQKTGLKAENLYSGYNGQFKFIVKHGTADDYSKDDTLTA